MVATAVARPTGAQRCTPTTAIFDAAGTALNGSERADYYHYVAATRAELYATTFLSAWAEGRAFSLEQAIVVTEKPGVRWRRCPYPHTADTHHIIVRPMRSSVSLLLHNS